LDLHIQVVVALMAGKGLFGMFRGLEKRLHKCISSGGNYFKEDKIGLEE